MKKPSYHYCALISIALLSPAEAFSEQQGNTEPSSRPLSSLLNDSNIGTVELHYFDPKTDDNGNSSNGGLGLKYDIKLEEKFGEKLNLETDQDFFSYSLSLEGTKTANAEENRHDYAKNSLALSWNMIQNIDQQVDCLPDDIGGEDFNPDDSCEGVFLDTNQYLLDFGLLASDESSQADDSYARTYGLTFDYILHPHTQSSAAKYNILDWPFRLIRKATNYDVDAGSQYAFPKVHIAYENVDPKEDDTRELIDPKLSDYDRLHAELAFVSVVGAIDNKELRFSASWRWWQEISASESIKGARLDEFIYRVYTLSLDNGFLISYTSGKLPFDREADAVWALGYQVHW